MKRNHSTKYQKKPKSDRLDECSLRLSNHYMLIHPELTLSELIRISLNKFLHSKLNEIYGSVPNSRYY